MLLESSLQSPAAGTSPVITLTLLHPIQSTPVQSWCFEEDDAIRIGRSTDNHVVLYSAVVSRNHVELRHNGQVWEVVNLGANGTYIDGKRVMQMPLHDGLVFRLARSGPNLQVHLGDTTGKNVAPIKANARSPLSRLMPPQDDDMPNTLGLPGADIALLESATQLAMTKMAVSSIVESSPPAQPELLFSTANGQPLKVLQTLGDYQVVKILGQGETAVTSLAWRLGRTVALKNLNAQVAAQPESAQVFAKLAQQLKRINHPGVPRVLEALEIKGKTYLAMEMVYGQTFSRYVAQNGVLPQREAIAWILELSETLAFIHGQGLVHGHITPKHVIRRSVVRSGQSIVLTDFGAVRLANWQQSGGFNPKGYLAPEQQDGSCTPQVDFYGLAITLAFLLTGQDPTRFYGEQDGFTRFEASRLPGVSQSMIDCLDHLTQPNPADRPASIESVMLILKQIV
jgi:pSer/pThr/pTyr-binding forkhead associated (FHA) protein